MSLKRKKSLFVEWNLLFLKNIERPFLLSFILVPFTTLIIVEAHSLNHLNQSAHKLENEIAQAIITGDSYLGTRVLKTIETALQLSFTEIKTQNGTFATSGEEPNFILQKFLWKVVLPVKSQWGDSIGTLTIISNPLPIQRVLALIFVIFSSAIFFVLNYLIKKFHIALNNQIIEIDTIVSALISDNPKTIEQNLVNVNFKNETASKLASALSNFILLKENLFIQSIKLEHR